MTNYSYQTKVANEVFEQMLTGKYIAGVVAACPGAGKTQISIIAIQKYIEMFPSARVVVLTHNMNVLKNQYIYDLTTSPYAPTFSFGGFGSGAQVRVGIPASFSRLDWGSADLLVVDECHEFWGEKMVTDIYKSLTPKHVLLLTGSPSTFVRHNHAVDVAYPNQKKYYISFVAGSDLSENKVFSPVVLDSVKTAGSSAQKIKSAISHAQSKGYNMEKILVACSTSEEASIVSYTLRTMGRKVSLSTSQTDSDSAAFTSFLKGESDTLVVVRRGILGFSDNNLTMVIDMKCSSDLEVRNQLFARVLRKSPKGVSKTYLTVPSAKKVTSEVRMLQGLIDFMKREKFSRYMGT